MGALLLIPLGLLQIFAGYVGLAETIGHGWAFGALAVFFVLGFSLPMTVGTFLCATEVWGWHWAGGLLLAAPGLLFLVPGVLAGAMAMVKGRRAG